MKHRMLRITIQLVLCLAMLLAPTVSAVAQDMPVAPAQPSELDDGSLEVGVCDVGDYQNCGGWGLGDLGGTAGDALGLRNRLTATSWFFGFPYPSPTWNAPIAWGNYNAYEKDWKRGAVGGWEESQIDTVDLAYFSGHGSRSGFFFGVTGNTHDDCQVTTNDAFASWGTRDNDWIGIGACNILEEPYDNGAGQGYRFWARAMNGTRLLMSMKTVMSDVDFGVPLGWYARWNNSWTQAWFRAADEKLPGSQVTRILAERNDYFNDTWAQHNAPTVVDAFFHVWTHQAGTPFAVTAAGASPSIAEQLAAVNYEMPVYELALLSTDDAANNRYAGLANTFGLTSTTPISGPVAASDVEALYENGSIYSSSNGDLLMDKSAGNYLYAETANLWNQAAVMRAAAANEVAITPEEAKRIADGFLQQNNMMPSDAQYTEVVQDTLAEYGDPTRFVANEVAAAMVPMTVLTETTTNYQVLYSRVLTYTPPPVAGAAPSQPIPFPVEGPGSIMKVYVDATVPAGLSAAALMQNAVIGSQGGYPAVNQMMAADGHTRLTTTVLPTTTINTLFQKIDEKVSLNHVTIPAVSKEIVDYILQYWQGPLGFNQSELIPVYKIVARATLSDTTTQDYTEYIPVNSTLMAPYADIISPTSTAVAPGTELNFTAADASKTLAALGVDPSLDFFLGTGDLFTYDWYHDSVDAANKFGTGLSAKYMLPMELGSDGKPGSLRIILVVTDSYSSSDLKTASDEMLFTVNNLFIPEVSKNE